MLLGGMGAGDVKLMAAVGSILGPTDVFTAFLYSALIGGLYALVVLYRHGALRDTLEQDRVGAGRLDSGDGPCRNRPSLPAQEPAPSVLRPGHFPRNGPGRSEAAIDAIGLEGNRTIERCSHRRCKVEGGS